MIRMILLIGGAVTGIVVLGVVIGAYGMRGVLEYNESHHGGILGLEPDEPLEAETAED